MARRKSTANTAPKTETKAEEVVQPKTADKFKERSLEEVQQALVAQGYKIRADGLENPRTRAAIRMYQKVKGLDVTGTADIATQKALFS